MAGDVPSLPPGSDLGQRTYQNRLRFRLALTQHDEFRRELAAAGWPDSAFRGIAKAARDELRQWREVLVHLPGRGMQPAAPDAELSHDSARIPDPILQACVGYTVRKVAVDAMGAAIEAAEARGESPNRPACEAYWAVWHSFPLLNATIMVAGWASPEQRDRAIVALSSWLMLGVKEGVSPELNAALRDADLGFLLALCERLPGAIVEAWYEQPEDARTPHALLNRATNMLRLEGRLKTLQRSDGTYESVAPSRLTGIEQEGDPDDLESFVLREEARQEALSRLAPREAEIFQLHLGGYSYAEIAEIADIKVGTIGPTLRRCWAKIESTGAP